MIDRRTMLLGSLATRIAGPIGTSCARGAAARGGAERDFVEELEGWRVRVDASLAAREAELWSEVSRMLRCQLGQIARKLPRRAVEASRQIEIHVGEVAAEKPCAVAGRFDSEALAVEIGDARAFLDAACERPWSLFHALALVYYRTLAGRDRAAVAAAHAAAAASGKYDRALGADGGYRRHPGLAGPAEYFAAASTALFGTSDCHPFVRSQLREIDPGGYESVFRLWRRPVRPHAGEDDALVASPPSAIASSPLAIATQPRAAVPHVAETPHRCAA